MTARRQRLGLLVVAVVLVAAVAILLPDPQAPAPRRAVAEVRGGPLAPALRATVEFRAADGGTLVSVTAAGLPPYQPARPGMDPIGPHGFHIHEKGDCRVGDPADPFLAAGGHWNPDGQPHGNHAGDFPVLFSQPPAGGAQMTFLTTRFRVPEVVGRSVIIHLHPDDYRTQPAGNSGPRLACGVIAAR